MSDGYQGTPSSLKGVPPPTNHLSYPRAREIEATLTDTISITAHAQTATVAVIAANAEVATGHGAALDATVETVEHLAPVVPLRPQRLAPVIDLRKQRDEEVEHARFLEVAKRGPGDPSYTTPAGKKIDLASCSTEELHEAMDALEAETVPEKYWLRLPEWKRRRR